MKCVREREAEGVKIRESPLTPLSFILCGGAGAFHVVNQRVVVLQRNGAD
jgi:hypothetical protein